MVSKIVSNKHTLLGYLVEDLYIPARLAQLYKDDGDYHETCIKRGSKVRQGIMVGSSVFEDISAVRLPERIVEVFKANNLELNSHFLCGFDSCFGESGIWKMKIDGCESYCIYSRLCEPLAYLFVNGSVHDKAIKIIMFEAVNKNIGHGSECIKYLQKYRIISGYATLRTKSFWLRNGATVQDDFHFTLERKVTRI